MLLMLLACATEKPLPEGEENDWLLPSHTGRAQRFSDPEPATDSLPSRASP